LGETGIGHSELKRRLRRADNSGSRQEIFVQVNQRFPAWRYKKLGAVNRPVSADIYRAPIERPTI